MNVGSMRCSRSVRVLRSLPGLFAALLTLVFACITAGCVA